MQQIERYGVIALVFLLVTIVAVSFWGDNKSPGFWSRLMGRGDAKKTATLESGTSSSMLPPSIAAERALQNPLPLSSAPQQPLVSNDAPVFQQPAADPLAALSAQPGAVPAPGLSMPTFEPVVHADPISAIAEEQVTESAPPQRVAQKPAPQAPAASVATSTYVVQKGDSLARIARAKLGSEQRWTEIQALNGGVDPKSLRVGMKLRLPSDAKHESLAPKSTPRANTPAKRSGGTYVVKGGDSLTRIAERVLGDGQRWKEIVALNPGIDPKRLAVGKSLKMPASASPSLVAAAVPVRSQNEKPRVR